MHRVFATFAVLAFSATTAFAQKKAPLVEFEMMTWP